MEEYRQQLGFCPVPKWGVYSASSDPQLDQGRGGIKRQQMHKRREGGGE